MTAISVKEIQAGDIEYLLNYWYSADAEYLQGMGADIKLLPDRQDWHKTLLEQIKKPYPEKQSYCMICLSDGIPSGHCNVNRIVYGQEACMHLHLWHKESRHAGTGSRMAELSIPYFFRNLHLEMLYCEPYRHNPATNKVLEKLGFELQKSYTCVPGTICFEQEVNLWQYTLQKYLNTI